jgi:two-component system CheB/CheR fusion protein
VTTVAIGASAGGLEALTELLRRLPPTLGAAYVIVQHLDPAHESLLAELLARVAPFPVTQATDNIPIQADRAYVIPPDTTMLVVDGHLRLARRKRTDTPARPIDLFFRSVADMNGGSAIGIVLSGTGTDGAAGLSAIKAAGGSTFAQDPKTARYDGMPRAAIATGCVDFVLAPGEIAKRLMEIARHPYITARAAAPRSADAVALDVAFQLLLRVSGVDFAQYKIGTIRRRIVRRMALRGVTKLPDYITVLQRDPVEVGALYADLLICVTRFFRDPVAFAALFETAFPKLLEQRPAGSAIRIWVPGCASGEEAYSVAIALLEFLGDRASSTRVQVFATDLSESAIATARAGLYPSSIEEDVSAQRLERFFVKADRGYRVARAVRAMCIFARHNVTEDPPFSQLDLVSCRNVLIYLDPGMHDRMLAMFHYALKPGGLLFLGSAESTIAAHALFSPLSHKYHIYARTDVPPIFPGLDMQARPNLGAPAGSPAKARTRSVGAPDVHRAADQVVLGSYAPGGVVVDAAYRIVQFRGGTSPYLEPAIGNASFDLLRMTRPELRRALREALRQAKDRMEAVRVDDLPVHADDAVRHVSIRVIPFRTGASDAQFFAVLFEGTRRAARSRLTARKSPAGPGNGDTKSAARADARLIGELRQEVEGLRHHVRAIVDDNASVLEGLQAATEEVQSANEELQSSNEELETAKEELQSANQELTTLNDELLARNGELGALSDDLSNLLANMQVPVILVTSDLRIRRYTAGAERLIDLTPTDIGRSIRDVSTNRGLPDLEQIITRVSATTQAEEREVRDDAGRWFSMTVRPYTTSEHAVEGAVIVYQDIDTRHRSADQLDAARFSADLANRMKSGFLTTMSHELRTPLNAISGYVGLIADGIRGPVTPEQTADLVRIRAAGRHLLGLINSILDYARLESGRVLFVYEAVLLDDMLAEAAAMIAPQAETKRLELDHVRCNATAAIRGDHDKVIQIVVNLLSNAVKFTPPGGRITLACDLSSERPAIVVADTGIGIRAEHLEGVFDPFVQVGPTLPGSDKGAGLGLSISRELARGMGGELTAQSVLGKGSTFTLVLPWDSPPPPARSDGPTASPGAPSDARA